MESTQQTAIVKNYGGGSTSEKVDESRSPDPAQLTLFGFSHHTVANMGFGVTGLGCGIVWVGGALSTDNHYLQLARLFLKTGLGLFAIGLGVVKLSELPPRFSFP